MTSAYYRGSDGVVVVFDVTAKESFEHVDSWMSELNRFADSAVKILIGNKVDLPGHVVPEEESELKAKRLGMTGGFVGVSAKTGADVEAAFVGVARELIRVREMGRAATAGLGEAGTTAGPFSLRDRLAEAPGIAAISNKCCNQ
jgi:Ras-related protein Rab-1A